MMLRRLSCLLLALAASAGCRSIPQNRVDGLRYDVAYVAEQLPRRHPDFFHQLHPDTFRAAVADLDRDVPELTDDEVKVRLASLVAMSGDSHTSLNPLQGSEKFFPFMFYWFDDGLRLVRTTRSHADVLGGRLVSVNGYGTEQVMAELSRLVPAENEAITRSAVPRLLMGPGVLMGLGLADHPDAVTMTLQMDDGTTDVREIDAVALSGETEWIDVIESASSPPLAWRHRGKNYWYEVLPEEGALFFQYNRCAQDPDVSFDAVAREAVAQAHEAGVERFIIDLRQNGGGNSAIADPFIRRLASDEVFSQPGRLFVLIGRRTFSSAILNAVRLKEGAGAILVGEASGGQPNHFGEVKLLTLPFSRLKLQHSSRYFELWPDAAGNSLVPDIPAPPTWASMKSGRDPALEACLAYRIES